MGTRAAILSCQADVPAELYQYRAVHHVQRYFLPEDQKDLGDEISYAKVFARLLHHHSVQQQALGLVTFEIGFFEPREIGERPLVSAVDGNT